MKTSVDPLPETQQRPAPAPLSPPSSALTLWSSLVPYALLATFTLLLLWPLCVGRGLYWGDILLYFEPMQRYAKTSFSAGKIPLWNPYVFGGQPFVGNPQMGVFYPSNLVAPFLPSWLYLNLSMLLHLYLCGAFMFLFLTRWTKSRSAALAGALTYMGSSALVGRLQFPPMIQTAAYTPLLLYCVDTCIDRFRLRAWLLTALVVGLTVLAAHPQMAYLSLCCAGVYGGARLWSRTVRASLLPPPRPGLSIPRILLLLRGCCLGAFPLLTATAVGLALTTVQTLPALQLLLASPREEMTADMANRFYLVLPDLLTLLFPNFFGHPISSDFWSNGNAWETALFIGWLPLYLIGIAILRRIREWSVRFWALGAFVCIWMATGTAGGLYWVAFFIVPGLSKFHDPARFLFLTTLAFAVLTAFGFDILRMRWEQRAPSSTARAVRLAMVGIALPLLWYGWRWNPTTDLYRTEPDALHADNAWPDPLSTHIAPNTRIFISAHENYWRRFITHGYADYGEQDTRTVQHFIETELPNLPMRSGIEAVSGYEPVQVVGASRLDNLNRVAGLRKDPSFSRLIGIWNVKTVVLPHEQHLQSSRFREIEKRSASHTRPTVTLWENRDSMPRAWLVRRTRHVESHLRILAALTSPEFDPSLEALISDLPHKRLVGNTLEWGGGKTQSLPVQPVTLLSSTAGEVAMSVDAGKAPAFLVYSGTAYPGWTATLDGQRIVVHRADGSLLGMHIPMGRHEVILRYTPDTFRFGLYLTLLTVAGLVSVATVGLLPARKGLLPARNRQET